jgi:superfamily II DNA or RNA helicase
MTPRLAPYQQEAVKRLLETIRRYGGALLADEPGLGKSWVAAAVAKLWREPVTFLVPAALVPQWRDLLHEFALAAEVRSHDSLLTRPLDAGGLLVVDEAHRFRNPGTKRYGELAIGALGRPLLLVTATPIANRLEDILALFRLFAADDLLRAEGVLSLSAAFRLREREAIAKAMELLVIRRGRGVVPQALQFGVLERHLVTTPQGSSDEAILAALERLTFPMVAALGEIRPLRALLRRRFESSEAALAATMHRQRRFYRRAREALLDGCRVSKAEVMRLFGAGDEDVPFQDLLFKPFWFAAGDASAADYEAIDRELAAIDELLRLLAAGDSPKAGALLSLLAATPLPALVFTVSTATARDLFERCRSKLRAGLVTSRFCRLNGLMTTREVVFDALTREKVDVLIATDVGGEGLNLQSAGSVIHYDLPWNPVRIDQRNGRAWRIGQKRSSVRCHIFVPRAARRDQVLSAIIRKGRISRAVLQPRARQDGAAVSPETACARAVLPPRVADPGVRKRWKKALRGAGAAVEEWERMLAAAYPAGVDLWLAAHSARAPELIEQAREMLVRARAAAARSISL